MKAVALLSTALAAALLIAAIAQAASLKKRIDLVPAPAAGAVSTAAVEPPLSPYEMAELARRVEACASAIEAKIDRENKRLTEAKERFSGIKARTDESLAALGKESGAIKDELGGKAADKEKVAELTKRIRTEQQKAMFKKFMGEQMKKETEKIKVDLELTPDQAAQFDKVSAEMFDKFAEVGSSFMDGEAAPAKFMELVTESNGKMKTFMSDDQFKKYEDYQKQRWGGARNQGGDQGGNSGDGGGQ